MATKKSNKIAKYLHILIKQKKCELNQNITNSTTANFSFCLSVVEAESTEVQWIFFQKWTGQTKLTLMKIW